jgi:hypothetical protein
MLLPKNLVSFVDLFARKRKLPLADEDSLRIVEVNASPRDIKTMRKLQQKPYDFYVPRAIVI